ncbi:MAG: adenosylhomocysteinase [candidate division WS1 bacterium]|nr:adenosylhomocysteinase [candidate division WS1 bacterium]
MDFDIAEAELSSAGEHRIRWADRRMQVLQLIRERFAEAQPLAGQRIACCLHVTSETANLMRTLQAGGAEVALCASNPLSTQDDTAASLVVDFGLSVFARHGEDRDTYYSHINSVLDLEPTITIDDGADLISTLHASRTSLLEKVKAGMEETTTGVIRLRAMAAHGALRYPVIAVNDAYTKHLFDNYYGTGQSTIDGILRATNLLLAGHTVVVCGYGSCGRGVALRARGMGALVIVCEVDPLRALQAAMDGYRVMPLLEAAPLGDVFVTVTGDKSVIDVPHFEVMKDGAILCNAGHFDVEINLKALEKLAVKVRRTRPAVDEYELREGRRLYVLAEGRLVNLAAAEGHPAAVMDMSFANQALCAEHVAQSEALPLEVMPVPAGIDRQVAELKLQALRVEIDTLTPEQRDYLASWEMGT